MADTSEPVTASPPRSSAHHIRLIAGILLLGAAVVFTWRTIDGLSSRRQLRIELAEISHARYDLLNVNVWVARIVPILNARIDALDLKASNQASLRPTVEKALYRLLDDVKAKMSVKDPKAPPASGFLGAGNAMMANLMVAALRPHVPEYAGVVLAELGKPETKDALKKYVKGVLDDAGKGTFGSVDMRWYSWVLDKHGCADATSCKQVLGERIREADAKLTFDYLTVLGSCALAFLLLLTGGPVLRRSGTVVLLLFCVVLLVGGVLTPMLEVEARISKLGITFMGSPIEFGDQVLYFQSKSVLEVFHTLITAGRPDMWIVGVLVLMFSVVFPILKILALTCCLFKPALLQRNGVMRFFALESSKWSMADVMALAIFMSFVAFNGLIPNTMAGLRETGAQLVIPTDSSKILPGYHLFIGFCLGSLFLSKKLQRGIQTGQNETSR